MPLLWSPIGSRPSDPQMCRCLSLPKHVTLSSTHAILESIQDNLAVNTGELPSTISPEACNASSATISSRLVSHPILHGQPIYFLFLFISFLTLMSLPFSLGPHINYKGLANDHRDEPELMVASKIGRSSLKTTALNATLAKLLGRKARKCHVQRVPSPSLGPVVGYGVTG